MARPVKYQTEEQRRDARRLQTRTHVKRHRDKKRNEEASRTRFLLTVGEQDPDRATHENPHDASTTPPIEHSPSSSRRSSDAIVALRSIPDLGQHSALPNVELYPNLMRTLAADMQRKHASYPYIQVVETLGGLDPSINLGVFMLGSLFFGTLQKDYKMIGWSQSAYKQILPVMRNMVENQDSQSTAVGVVPQVLNNVLMSTELLECATSMSESERCQWVIHHRASPQIFESCGPMAFQGTLGLWLLRIMRPRIVFMALYYGSSAFLDHDDWRRIPFLGSTRTNEDNLWHLVEILPGCFQQAQFIQEQYAVDGADSAEAAEEIRTLWRKVVYLKNVFEVWMKGFEESSGELHFQPEEEPYSVNVLHKPPLPFPSLAIAKQLNTYLYHMYLLLTFMKSYYQQNYDILKNEADLPPVDLPQTDQISALIWRLCQTFVYISSVGADVELMMYSVSYPNRSLMEYFGKDPVKFGKEIYWCSTLARQIGNMDFLGKVTEFFLDCYYPPVNGREMWSG